MQFRVTGGASGGAGPAAVQETPSVYGVTERGRVGVHSRFLAPWRVMREPNYRADRGAGASHLGGNFTMPKENLPLVGRLLSSKVIFSVPWFDVVAKTLHGQGPPYYMLQMLDYVTVLALTVDGGVLLVRQYRPTIEDYTLELPSGHVEQGESPAEAARRELLEETGYQAGALELLGCLAPDTGRLANRMWCFYAPGVSRCCPNPPQERGIELLVCSQHDLMRYIADSHLNHAMHLAAVLLALLRGKLSQAICESVAHPNGRSEK